MKFIIYLILFIVLVYCSSDTIAATPFVKVVLSDNATMGVHNALCNDGTPAVFYWRPGTTRQFIVHLQGGYWCWDEPSCLSRAASSPELTSSASYGAQPPSYIGAAGLFDQDPAKNPVWSGANLAYMMYCSSDANSGNSTALFSSGTQLWRFFGRNILESAFSLLIRSPDFGRMTFKDDILLSGCSAGAQGVINSADFVRGLLPALFDGNAPLRFRAMADAGWMMSPQPLYSTTPSILSEFVSAAVLWGGSPAAKCALSNPANMLPLCYLTEFAWPHMETAVFIQSSQYDGFQTPYNAGGGPPYNGTTLEYVNSVRSLFNYSMQEVKPPSAIFSPTCYYHCISEDDNFYNMKIPNAQGELLSMNQTFSAWYYSDSIEITNYSLQSQCSGFDCGVGCPN